MKTKKRGYEVFMMYSPAHVPFNFADHNWFVLNENGKIYRYEVMFSKNKDKRLGHLYINYFKPFEGVSIFPLIKKWKWKSHFLHKINGKKAKKLIKVIKESPKNYPPILNYRLLGNNSNTYVRWALKKAGISKKLTWKSFGN